MHLCWIKVLEMIRDAEKPKTRKEETKAENRNTEINDGNY